mmetsp:Transcript_4310/g.5017  ORF Transcript_4310/g.5017 Transcript_4310/m.5017 type:complete len:348 (+) Transcript_4310:73-1116(+)
MYLRPQIFGASLLLYRLSSLNAFARVNKNTSSRLLQSIQMSSRSTQRSHQLSMASSQLLPNAISVPPGESPVEEQDNHNPIDESCTVLVVGASRGIGLEFVKQCLQKGATVIATHRLNDVPTSLSNLSNSISSNDDDNNNNYMTGKLHTIQMDLEDETSISQAAKDLQNKSTTSTIPLLPLTHIIHNAGIYLPENSFNGEASGTRAAAPKVTKEAMMKTFEVNTIAPMLVAQSFAPLLGRRSDTLFPILAFVSSKVGSVSDNGSGGAYAYRSSKSALNVIAKSLSVDLGDKARVVLLHPGWVQTDMTKGNGLIDAHTSVSGMLKAVENTISSTGFRFVDYKACQIPW